eukprot:jgi/Picsp_1/336/NSC_00335-R1_glutamate-gated kainate-type ion channel receptor subunit 5
MDSWAPSLVVRAITLLVVGSLFQGVVGEERVGAATQNVTKGIPYFEDKNKLTICTSEWTPSVICSGLGNPLQWSGYEIELFRATMPLMGWTFDMLDWRCLDWDEMEDLLINTEECDIFPAGVSPEMRLTDEGVQFSGATMESGLGILTRAEDSANLTFLVWNFTGFIVMALYCANLTSNLTISQIQADIRSVEDLSGKSVGTWDDYVDVLRKDYKIFAEGYPWNDAQDEKFMLRGLLDGDFDALVLDYSTLSVMDSASCETRLIPTQFNLFDFAVAFPKSAANRTDMIKAYNNALRNLKEFGTIELLQNRYLSLGIQDCKSGKTGTNRSSVTWDQVAGLWIILGVTVGIGILLVLAYRIWNVKKSRLYQKPWFQRMFPFLCVPKNVLANTMKKLQSQTSQRSQYSDDSSIKPMIVDDPPEREILIQFKLLTEQMHRLERSLNARKDVSEEEAAFYA